MRIGLCGSQNTGKSTVIDTALKYWPMYKIPSTTYREIVKEKNLPINQDGTLEAQRIIRDALCDQAINNAEEKYMFHDRTIMDNVAYSLWLAEKNKFTEDPADVNNFITTSLLLMRNTIKLYDVIFYVPINPAIQMAAKEQRALDLDYQLEIDSIFYALYQAYRNGDDAFFDMKDTPPIIELPASLNERIDTMKLYINDAGNAMETEKSVLSEIADLEIPENLLKQVMGKK